MIKTEPWAIAFYSAVALAVLLPLFAPGFILTLDMVFTPELAMPSQVTSSYLFHASLHVLNFIIPSDILQKAMLLGILLLSSIGMHRLIRTIATRQPIDWGIYIASVFFAINPFTYSRFMAGQYAVLLGYALLPWLVQQAIAWVRQPSWTRTFKLSGLAVSIGIVSIHTLWAVTVLSLIGVIILLSTHRKKLRALAPYGVAAIGLFAVLSSYWLVPLLLGHGKTADWVASMSTADVAAFQTAGDSAVARIANTVRLQGFWAEEKNLYLLPQDRAVLWGLMSLIFIGLTITGAIYLWKTRRSLVMWFGGSALIGLTIAVIPAGQHTLLLAGLREPHKLLMLLALAYGIFLAFGINAVLTRMQKKSELRYAMAAVLLLALPFVHMRVMLWGFDGQLTPRHYPNDWFTVSQQLQEETPSGDVLFLPWHHYMSYSFAGRIIASPAPGFFGENIVVNQDPELDGASGGKTDARQQMLTDILHGKLQSSNALALQNIEYIIVVKELDWQQYDYLSNDPGLTLTTDHPTIRVYKNHAWRQAE